MLPTLLVRLESPVTNLAALCCTVSIIDINYPRCLMHIQAGICDSLYSDDRVRCRFPRFGKLDMSSVVNSEENCSLRISAFSPGLSWVLHLSMLNVTCSDDRQFDNLRDFLPDLGITRVNKNIFICGAHIKLLGTRLYNRQRICGVPDILSVHRGFELRKSGVYMPVQFKKSTHGVLIPVGTVKLENYSCSGTAKSKTPTKGQNFCEMTDIYFHEIIM